MLHQSSKGEAIILGNTCYCSCVVVWIFYFSRYFHIFFDIIKEATIKKWTRENLWKWCLLLNRKQLFFSPIYLISIFHVNIIKIMSQSSPQNLNDMFHTVLFFIFLYSCLKRRVMVVYVTWWIQCFFLVWRRHHSHFF